MIHNLDEERLVLGGLMTSEIVRQNARGVITEECFDHITHKELFSAIHSLDKEGKEVDVISVLTRYNASAKQLMDPYTITEYADAYTSGGLETHIQNLIDYSVRRKLNEIAYSVVRDCNDPLIAPETIQEFMLREINNILARNDDTTLTISKSVDKLTEIVEENREAGKSVGISTGFSVLDAAGGFHPSDLVVIAAESSQGKTAFALSIAKHMIENGHPCVFYSMEMLHYQLTARLVSMRAGVTSSDIQYNPLQESDYWKVRQSMEYMRTNPMFYDDKSTQNFERLLSSIRKMKLQHNIECVFIDYIQLIRNSERNMNDQQWLAVVARDLKNLAKDLEIPIVILSQLNRDNDNPEPTVGRLRGSGQINEASDITLLLYRPEYYSSSKPFPAPYEAYDTHNAALIKVGKGRNIGTKDFLCKFYPEITLFTDEPVDKRNGNASQPQQTNIQTYPF